MQAVDALLSAFRAHYPVLLREQCRVGVVLRLVSPSDCLLFPKRLYAEKIIDPFGENHCEEINFPGPEAAQAIYEAALRLKFIWTDAACRQKLRRKPSTGFYAQLSAW